MAPPVSATQADPRATIDKLTPGLFFLAALIVRLGEASLLSFPGLDDPAFYLSVAENLAEGRGLIIDALWELPDALFPGNTSQQ